MKKLSIFAVLAALGLINLPAQEVNFGLKGGVDFASVRLEMEGENISTSDTGFYIGMLMEVELSETFAFQPELLYVSVEDLDFIAVPLLAKFPIAESFGIMAGPSLGFLLDTADGEKSFNFGLDAGIAYDINENFFIDARYSLGLANLLEDAPSGYSLKLNGFFAGIGYKF
ncbi:porin family protein [Aestuariivivens marinum]|uniref:porin family protein n=1 Tax=Aestuariivivens marinum TaxID=2913555 RepID=UPI001F56F38E|nr:porin family protein [Aestuariivivens marinum]